MDSPYLAEFKSFAGLDLDITDTDITINICLNSAEEFINKYCNINLANSTESITLTLPTPQDKLYIPKAPLIAVDNITVNGATVDPNTYYVKGQFVLSIPSSNIFLAGKDSITLDAQYGYIEIPAPLKEALFKLAYKCYTDIIENRDSMSSYSTGNDITERFKPTEFPAGVKQILLQYYNVVV